MPSSFEVFEAAIKEAVDQRVLAGVAVVAAKRDHPLVYSGAFGKVSADEDASPMSLDKVLLLASSVKLIWSISVLQAVERGLLDLDEPVHKHVPELTPPLHTIEASDSPEAAFRMSTTDRHITLRRLLTHTSGFSYNGMHPLLRAWKSAQPETDKDSQAPIPDVVKEHSMPLLFPPGSKGKWEYGASVEWATLVLERATGVSVATWIDENISEPLGLTSMTRCPHKDPEKRSRMIPRVKRTPDGGIENAGLPALADDPRDNIGFHCSVVDYVVILKSLLRDDGRLLSSATIQEMFRPQLTQTPELNETLAKNDDAVFAVKHTPTASASELTWNHGLGGLLSVSGVPGKAGRGTMCWSGMFNFLWFLDRERGVCGAFGCQLYPVGDGKVYELFELFQKQAYDSINA